MRLPQVLHRAVAWISSPEPYRRSQWLTGCKGVLGHPFLLKWMQWGGLVRPSRGFGRLKNRSKPPSAQHIEVSGRDWVLFPRFILAMISQVPGIIGFQRPVHGLRRRKPLSSPIDGAV